LFVRFVTAKELIDAIARKCHRNFTAGFARNEKRRQKRIVSDGFGLARENFNELIDRRLRANHDLMVIRAKMPRDLGILRQQIDQRRAGRDHFAADVIDKVVRALAAEMEP